jgi:hypothetical protein
MADVTYRVELPFAMADDWSQATRSDRMHKRECGVPKFLARRQGSVGAIALSQTGDPSLGEFAGAPTENIGIARRASPYYFALPLLCE